MDGYHFTLIIIILLMFSFINYQHLESKKNNNKNYEIKTFCEIPTDFDDIVKIQYIYNLTESLDFDKYAKDNILRKIENEKDILKYQICKEIGKKEYEKFTKKDK